ncbi:HEAVY CHAIN putative EXPRESSED-RELATED-RELATED [Salix viminalis]|uniref:HEAVY CHAIN putative EXPRESSED-RELATED-RELATED n=1 Tax=Salix viminalis TaxID=40686 RepID=A0A9Q0QJI8_SALVM|nr:HEAVY CHAIN putative EXPRESSED-RELATED-RELATED [Salix viminalis]
MKQSLPRIWTLREEMTKNFTQLRKKWLGLGKRVFSSELRHVAEETVRLKKEKERADITAQNLKSKLLREKSKLETASAVEEKAKSILSSLSVTLEQLKTETEVEKKEKKLISEETANIRSEIHKTESQMDFTDGKLQAAIRELQGVKSSESLALENLRNKKKKKIAAYREHLEQKSLISASLPSFICLHFIHCHALETSNCGFCVKHSSLFNGRLNVSNKTVMFWMFLCIKYKF